MPLPPSGGWQLGSDEALAGMPLSDLIKSPQGGPPGDDTRSHLRREAASDCC